MRAQGNQLRFAIKTVKGIFSGKRDAAESRPMFGNQIRFAIRTIKAVIAHSRASRV